jgi:hypothetical protein
VFGWKAGNLFAFTLLVETGKRRSVLDVASSDLVPRGLAVDFQTVSLIATVILAIVGYVVTYANNIRIENRKAKIKFISDQLQYLYGPLFTLSDASNQAWIAFRSRWRPGGPFFGTIPPPSAEELEQWRLWMAEVFMPLNLKMETVIVENSHLINGPGMPGEFRKFLSHVEAYKTTVKSWENGDLKYHTSYSNYPKEFNRMVEKAYAELKKKQAEMIGM